MSESDNENSNMFKVDQSGQFVQETSQSRMDNFFTHDKQILDDNRRRKVVFGQLEEEKKTIYEVIQPYLVKAATSTGEAAMYAGKNIISAIANGATWVYDKFVNTVIPYTAQEIPKLIFIIKGGKNKDKKNYESEAYNVLQIEEDDYEKIKKQRKSNKKRVIVPLSADEDPEFIKFLEKQNYVVDSSFPIDIESDTEEETLLIPSGRFMVLHNETTQKNKSLPQNSIKQEQEIQQAQTKVEQKKQQEEDYSIMRSLREQPEPKVEEYKKVPKPKKALKLKGCYMFELQGQNSNEYDLWDQIERDESTQQGYLINSKSITISNSDDNGDNSGQVPLLIEKNVTTKKVVDADIKVRVQIPKKQEVVEDEISKKLQLA